MYTIKRMPEFDEWIGSLRDRQTSLRLLRRLEKAPRGLLGDVAPVGDGVSGHISGVTNHDQNSKSKHFV